MKTFLLITPLVLLIAACNTGSSDSEYRSDIEQRQWKIGIAPIPRNFGTATTEDWLDMFTNIGECAELITAQNPWRDSAAKSGEIPEFIQLMCEQRNTYGYDVLCGINFFEQSGAYDPILALESAPVNDWTNDEAAGLYSAAAERICAQYKPPYFALALEVNAYYLKHPDDFARFLDRYTAMYDRIKTVSPDTKVFVTFQLEMMKGIGDDTWGMTVEPHWEMIERFGDRLDLLVFTSYPEVEYSQATAIPDTYYSEIRDHSNLKTAIAEIGWSSTKYSEEDQTAFLERSVKQLDTLDMEFINWIFMHDLPGDGPLKKTGLRNPDGSEKEAWNSWCTLRKLPYKEGRTSLQPFTVRIFL